jgi:hypothetical protein
MKGDRSLALWLVALSALASAGARPVRAAVDRDVALVLRAEGEARVQRVVSKQWEDVVRGKRLDSGDLVRTGAKALVAVVFTDDKSLLKIRSNSEVVIRGSRQQASVAKRILLNLGEIWARVAQGQADFRVETPSGVAAVKGTEFYATMDAEGTFTVIAVSGLLELSNQFGSAFLRAGETGQMRKGEPPSVTPTTGYEDWAREQPGEEEIEIEFEDSSGGKKILRIRLQPQQ